MIAEYNHTKFGVDIFDEMVRRYCYVPRTNRWPLRLFFFMIEAAALNAFTLTSSQNSRRSFLHQLSDQLMEEQIRNRPNPDHWLIKIYREMAASLDDVKDKVAGNKESSMSHCHMCRKTIRNAQMCERCSKPVCSDHLQQHYYCDNCHLNVCESVSPPRKKISTTFNSVHASRGNCYICGTEVKNFCMICNTPMCHNHRHPNDLTVCQNCIP